MRFALMGASLGAVLALSATPAVGQHMNAKDAPCRRPSTTVDQVSCLSRVVNARDQELATVLGFVQPAVGGDELDLLNRAQVSWTDYRRLSCEAERAMYGGGTAASTADLACLEALTRDRIKQLHAAYDWRVEKHQWTVAHPYSGRP